ncbi:MAG: gliding motility-associated C-terminal domain-containing protein [Lewinellaceae bacterium]|nr:gliding motility-associated C-terminal domain-containing protein [Lewinellaceae bacterium]
MMNRLLLSRQTQLLLALCLLPWTFNLYAQCECTIPAMNNGVQSCTGDVFTLSYSGQDTFYVGANCAGNLLFPLGAVSVSPAFNSNTYSASLTGYNLGDMIPGGSVVTVHYIVVGNSASDTLCFRLTFLDTLPPAINTTLSNDTVICEMADYTTWWQNQLDTLQAYATDNCGMNSYSHSGPAFLTDNCGTFLDTFFVEDNSGNISFTTASYTIYDTLPPTLIGVPNDTTINCSALVPPPPMITAVDNCAASVVAILMQDTVQVTNSACAPYRYDIRRIWTSTDGCGNFERDTQLIHINDLVLPDFDIPLDTTIVCGADTNLMVFGTLTNVSDNCADVSELDTTFSQVIVGGACSQERTISRTWKVLDPCGNERTKTQVITVIDTIPPTVVFPADIAVDCADAGSLSVTGQPSMVVDNCTTHPITTNTDVIVAGTCTHSYTIQRTWTVSDGCGNDVDSLQIITVTDGTAPTFTNQAQNQTIACDEDIDNLFSAWLANHGAAVATDNCTDTLIWTAYNAGTDTLAFLPGPDCSNPSAGVFRKRTVDFVVSDQCGNRDTTTATFTVADNTPPVLTNCPTSMTVNTDPGVCETILTLPLPLVTEDCGNVPFAYNYSITDTLKIPQGMDPVETPINNVVFNFPVQGPPYTAAGNATLKIILDMVDAEAPTEYLNVFGEDGSLLGPVAHTPFQCGDTMSNFTITAAQLNDWAFDGSVTITVAPNVPSNQPGRFSVNPICPGNTVTGNLSFTSNFPDNLTFEYSLNGGARIAVDPISFITLVGSGTTSVSYYFTDCALNEASCSFDITVEDHEPPTISCPQDITINLDPSECAMDVEIPLFTGVTDNCGVTNPNTQTQPADSLSKLITFSYNPNLTDFTAEDKTFVFSGLQGNATPGGVQLIITLQGDIDSTGEYFEIYDNDNVLIGTTAPGQANVVAGDCNTPSTAVFTIPAATFNDWASAGNITITAKSYQGFPIPPAGQGWGINPCDTSQVHVDGDTDGSFITATFTYESVAPTFSATGANTIDPVVLNPPLEPATYNLVQGVTTFHYQLTDLAGNVGECTFDVSLVDTEAPTVLCGPSFVDINPSGFVVDTIYPNEIDLGSTDNCTIASMTVTPNIITCNDAGILDVVLAVTDQSGNISTCSTFVNVTTQAPQPSAFSNCGSTSLQLFANPPATTGNNVFQYVWYDPNGVPFAYVKNPIIQNASTNDLGFYTVEIQGVTGCQSVASVQVTCDLLPLQKPAIQTQTPIVCENQIIQLSTAAVCGTTVKYKWYAGVAPNGMLMNTTTVPAYTMTPAASGTFNFYVVVERNGCNSTASEAISVLVKTTPVALPSQANITVCEGDQILLNSINNSPGTVCHWTGPCGFESFNCSPAPINNGTMCNGGVYQLTVSNGGCESDPSLVSVIVNIRPVKPGIVNSTTANTPACDGASVTLTATNVAGAVSYLWTTPMLTTISTPGNVLTLPNADINKDAGPWTVKAIGNPCESEVSAPTTVYIVAKPQGVTAAVTPTAVCEGQSFQLSASSASQNVSFKWTYPNGQTTVLPNPVIPAASNANNGNYTLMVTNQFGCSVQNAVQLNVLPRVRIDGAAPMGIPVCVDGPINISLVSTLFPLDDGTYQYAWTGPNGYFSADTVAIIPGATSSNNGTYTLVVTNSDGCSSLPYTLEVSVPNIIPTPTGPPVISPGNTTFCEGDNVTLTIPPYPGPNGQYEWTGPSGIYLTSTPTLTLNDLEASDAGAYTVRYMINDCPSAPSGSVTLVVNTAPVITAGYNGPVCEGNVLSLNVACTNGATYEWDGPNGFSSSVCNPSIPNANPALHAGTYTVRKRLNGCWSDLSSILVEINEEPVVPTAINAGPFCGSTENVILSVTANSATPGANYTWYNSSGVPLGNATPSLNFALPDPSQYNNGSYEFYVVAATDGCPSTPSVPTTVTINTIPANTAEAGPDIEACQGDILTLQATPPTIGSGLWILVAGNPNGVSIANPNQATTTIAGLTPNENYLFQWTLSNGACEGYSSDQATVYVNLVEQANAGNAITVCHTSLTQLNAIVPVSNQGVWTQPNAQAQLGIVIVDPANPKTQITGLVPGNTYQFTWTINGGCGSSSSVVLVTVTNEDAYAGADFQDCGDGCTEISAIDALSGNGMWTSPDTSISIATPTNAATTICDLKPGNNILIWTIDDGACGQYSVDSVVIEYQIAPILEADAATVEFGGTTALNVISNDIIPGFFNLSVIQEPLHGKAKLEFNGQLSYQADINFVGQDILIYEVCVDGCDCQTATVVFNVGENAKCEIPTIITPNNDGINDAFIVPCISNSDRYPASKVGIFNQWGDEVFHAEPYKNDWKGTFDGEDLPAGTYFYIVDFGDGEKPKAGYLILQR